MKHHSNTFVIYDRTNWQWDKDETVRQNYLLWTDIFHGRGKVVSYVISRDILWHRELRESRPIIDYPAFTIDNMIPVEVGIVKYIDLGLSSDKYSKITIFDTRFGDVRVK